MFFRALTRVLRPQIIRNIAPSLAVMNRHLQIHNLVQLQFTIYGQLEESEESDEIVQMQIIDPRDELSLLSAGLDP